MQVDIPLSDNLDDIRKAIAKVMGVKSCRVKKMWKVSLSCIIRVSFRSNLSRSKIHMSGQ